MGVKDLDAPRCTTEVCTYSKQEQTGEVGVLQEQTGEVGVLQDQTGEVGVLQEQTGEVGVLGYIQSHGNRNSRVSCVEEQGQVGEVAVDVLISRGQEYYRNTYSLTGT